VRCVRRGTGRPQRDGRTDNVSCCSAKRFERLYFLPFGDWLFFNTSRSPVYELLYAVWASGSVTHGWIHASSDCFYLHIIAFICGQFEFLIATLGQTEGDADISPCIRHHQQLLR